MNRMTAAEAVWYALADLHRAHPRQQAFGKQAIADHAIQHGYWNLQRNTLYQHLSQWVNAQSPSESARAAYVVGAGRGGPYRLVQPGDEVAAHRHALPRHPDPKGVSDREDAVRWYRSKYASPARPPRPMRNVPVNAETAEAVQAYARSHGLDEADAATKLLRRGLAELLRDDPMFGLIGAAEGDGSSGEHHDEVLY